MEKSFLFLFFLILNFFLFTNHKAVFSASNIPSFPGAQGFGSQTIGGRGGRVIKVTNLNGSGSGSLKEAIEASGPRIVIFDVSGIIDLNYDSIKIKNPYLTIAGQTAPGGGILIKGRIKLVDTHDIVLRYLKIYSEDPGAPKADSSNSIEFNGEINNVVVDHCSIAWATDENITFYNDAGNGKDIRNVVFQWNLIAEGDRDSTHSESQRDWGSHSCGALLSTRSFDEVIENISLHHNLFAHNNSRNPLVAQGASTVSSAEKGVFRFINNVIYNSSGVTLAVQENGALRMDIIGNYFRLGPNTDTSYFRNSFIASCEAHHSGVEGDCYVYSKGNLIQNNGLGATSPAGAKVVSSNGADPRLTLLSLPLLDDGVTIESSENALKNIINFVGANLPPSSLLSRNKYTRDSIEQRIINELKTATGTVGIDKDNIRRYPSLHSAIPPTDTDHDGMPDTWERQSNLNPESNDSALDRNNDGYTNIEEYINSLTSDFNISTPTSTSSSSCPVCSSSPPKSTGNANCDTSINISDFAIWKTEYLQYRQTNQSSNNYNSDFNCDSQVTISDFAIWKTNYLESR
ncbi:hypothetical protein KKB16_04170 [Patescibacteria group bacterium]|nr:hypothetical protein [Patescibacteria group bacterium]